MERKQLTPEVEKAIQQDMAWRALQSAWAEGREPIYTPTYSIGELYALIAAQTIWERRPQS